MGEKLGLFGQEITSRISNVSNRLESLEKRQVQGQHDNQRNTGPGNNWGVGSSNHIQASSTSSSSSISSNNINNFHYNKIANRSGSTQNKRCSTTTTAACNIQQQQPQRSPLAQVLSNAVISAKENTKNRKMKDTSAVDISPRTKTQKNEEALKNFKAKQLRQETEACDDLLHKTYTDTIEHLIKNKIRRNPFDNKAEHFDTAFGNEISVLQAKLACKKPAKPITRRREALLECLAEHQDSTMQLSATTVGSKIAEKVRAIIKNHTTENYIDGFKAKLKLRENDEYSLFCVIAATSVMSELRAVQREEREAIERAERYARDNGKEDDDEFSPLGGSKKYEETLSEAEEDFMSDFLTGNSNNDEGNQAGGARDVEMGVTTTTTTTGGKGGGINDWEAVDGEIFDLEEMPDLLGLGVDGDFIQMDTQGTFSFNPSQPSGAVSSSRRAGRGNSSF
ncbi:unnamed protein product [Amoebophrya sp. A25]|nr:unnamed protein product [Amoebophrya sp. A25]|eukprot:GSA25T00003535001.1